MHKNDNVKNKYKFEYDSDNMVIEHNRKSNSLQSTTA